MTTFLLILQSIGLLFAAGAAAASLLKSKGFEEIEIPSPIIGAPKKTIRRLTREARIGVSMVIAGLVVSFAAKIIEQSITNKRNAENQQATSNQLALLQTSVHEVRRLEGQIRTLDAEITIRLFATNEAFLQLRTYFAQRAALYLDDKWSAAFSNKEEEMAGPSHHLRAYFDRRSGARQRENSFSLSGRYLEWWDGGNNKPKIESYLISDAQPTSLASEPGLRLITEFLQVLSTKACQVRFCKEVTVPLGGMKFVVRTNLQEGDVGVSLESEKKVLESLGFVFDSNGQVKHHVFFEEFLCAISPEVREAQLTYDTTCAEIALHCHVRFPTEKWERLQPTVSFSDLSGRSAFLVLPDLVNEHLPETTIDLQLIIDGTRLFPYNICPVSRLPKIGRTPTPPAKLAREVWSRVPDLPNTSIYKASLPDMDKP